MYGEVDQQEVLHGLPLSGNGFPYGSPDPGLVEVNVGEERIQEGGSRAEDG